MVRRHRILLAVLLLTGFALCGCSGTGSNFDPMDWVSGDWLSPKVPLPGKREPVFPEGVPGVPQGVPKELVKGNQQAAIDAAETLPPEPAPAAKPAPKPQAARPAPKPRTASAPPPASTTRAVAPPPQQRAATPPAAPWPDGSTAQPSNNAPASSAPAAKGNSQVDWPGPDSSTFSR